MSNQADKSMANLKEITGQLLAIVRTARQIPPGPSHFALATQASELVARAVRDHGNSICLPGLVLFCSREFIRTRNCSPQEAPNWRSIGHDNPQLMRHSWRSKALTWQALGDHSFDLAHEVDGGDTNNAPGPSTSVDGDALEKGKGKEAAFFLNVEAGPKVGDEDAEEGKVGAGMEIEGIGGFIGRGGGRGRVLEAPLRHTIGDCHSAGFPRPTIKALWASLIPGLSEEGPLRPWNGKLDCLPRVPKSNIQQTPPLMRPDIPESSQATSESPRDVAPVVDAGAILILGPSAVWTRSQSQGPSVAPSEPQGIPPKPRSRGRSKPSGSATMPIPPAAVIASLSSAAPHASQDLPIPDLHWMSITIHESANCITALEARASEQESTIDTLRRLHESLRCQIMQQHLSFPLLHSPPAATSSLLLDQAAPGSQSHVHLAPLPLIDFSTNSTGEESSTIVALVMEPTIPPSQTEAVLDPAPAIASTVPVDAVHSLADDGASTFALAFALPGPPEMHPSPLETPADGPLEMHPSPLETPEDGPGVAEIVECGSPLNLLPEYDSSDEQDATMQIVLNNQYRIPNIMQTSEPRACNKESQGPSPEHLGARYSVFAFPLSILGSPSPKHLGACWFSSRYLILGDRFTIPNPLYQYSVLGTQYLVRPLVHVLVLDPRYLILAARFNIPDPQHSVVSPQSSILGTRYSVPGSPSPALELHTQVAIRHPRSSVLGSQLLVLNPRDLILTPRFAISNPQYLVFSTRYSIGHTRYLRFATLDPRYSVLQYLILTARFAIPDPRYSGLGTWCSVCHTQYSFI
ncbi:uncharacterized protein EDB91DRAFT_1087851 [Suillus paluster]|uniref:uncharacterized protein n=1 Tax=Suillus paluster TaxID=48578 RepID=UPI001B875D99|nr:uncharacterized protein EDB91DRAFT_1087851 [Suillus paluster]KAG1723305.1 hypothetical protein EDB91DRAFT_1087851 [Suillus paluster]